jgi:hypothetical protein
MFPLYLLILAELYDRALGSAIVLLGPAQGAIRGAWPRSALEARRWIKISN